MTFKFKKVEINYSTDDCNERELHLEKIYVPKKERGKGLAKQALKEFIKHVRENLSEQYDTIGTYLYGDEVGIETAGLVRLVEAAGFELAECPDCYALKI